MGIGMGMGRFFEEERRSSEHSEPEQRSGGGRWKCTDFEGLRV